ncbi:toll/interleukin-1 receptor domain-containing protein [Bradyrhizobium tropiciagri]|uniref:toll/interleukin-1 receptor domain-containing protein n=1 Tax=Bradyrhizobium tropiciagri TaxID=312253 RepID=UPI001BAC350D|nr:toll/interleukin-1 receptor domain-containing protein [Bradyrhizobium tropiciagri]MBR0895161.1 toll/interleukin-1 receptor domain-containing protein [Bradyrhizobium tropiciagri]
MPDDQQSPIEVTRQALSDVVATLREFPQDCRLDSTVPPGLDGVTLSTLLNFPAAAEALNRMRRRWPPGFYSLFVAVSSLIPQILQMYGWRPDALRQPGRVMAAALADPNLRQLIVTTGQVANEMREADVGEQRAEQNPIMFGIGRTPQTLMHHIAAEVVARGTPFGRMLQVMLGPESPSILGNPSEKGIGNMQPHEFSRVGWPKLSHISDQIEIEHELTAASAPGNAAAQVAKCMVGLCWSMAAMASLVQPGIFIAEADPHLSSNRNGQLTISYGRGTHLLINYQPASMISVVEICLAALAEPDITACDLMWMAAGAATTEFVRAGTGADPVAPRSSLYDTFLSHRGLDAKSRLAHALRQHGEPRRVFLDCLTMPHGVINRAFVFGSLARSKSVMVVDTSNFSGSAWCRKELWFSEILGRHGRLQLTRETLDKTLELLARTDSSTEESEPRHGEEEFIYRIAPRIMRDFDYELRAPNRASAKSKGLDVSLLAPVEGLIGRADVAASVLAETVLGMLREVTSTPASEERNDLWCAALQLTLAAIGPEVRARSKMEVRGGVDRLNALVSRILSKDIQNHPVFQAAAPRYLALVASVVLIDLAGFALDQIAVDVIEKLTNGVAFLHNQTLVLDVRDPGPKRDLHFRLLMAAIRSNLGGLTILQTAADPVHELEIDGETLSVLPCVTLYPGMEDLFAEAHGSS